MQSHSESSIQSVLIGKYSIKRVQTDLEYQSIKSIEAF